MSVLGALCTGRLATAMSRPLQRTVLPRVTMPVTVASRAFASRTPHTLASRWISSQKQIVSRLGSTNIALNHQFSGIGRRALSNSSRVLQATASTSAATLQSAGTAQATSVPPIVGYWLMGSAALVFGIVVLGGLTRLTESGLSIVEWNVLKGVWPPIGQKAWEEEFEKYKQYPEYKVLNRGMTLDEFKKIFYMEWAHRLWGRAIGLSFILPAIYFWRRGWLPGALGRRVLGISALIGFQGVLGWYMVKSGLDEELIEKRAVPRVSQYRLAAHLGSAVLIYISQLWVGWDVLKANRVTTEAAKQAAAKMLQHPGIRRLGIAATGLTGLVFLTAMSGAFVAGLDAGLIYDTFPKMGERWVPPAEEIWTVDFVQPGDNGRWRNIFENPTTVQFNHRILGITTATMTTLLWLYARRQPLPPHIRRLVHILLAAAGAQVTLGISTLLYNVPIPLASAHQTGSLVVLTAALHLAHALKRSPIKF